LTACQAFSALLAALSLESLVVLRFQEYPDLQRSIEAIEWRSAEPVRNLANSIAELTADPEKQGNLKGLIGRRAGNLEW
jgi:hypothetical protein